MKPKHADLIHAWADGAKIEQAMRDADGKQIWHVPKIITWRENNIYRIKHEWKEVK